jgi:predicted nucleic acid-binding protein
MKVVVADTSPLNYLVLINSIEILPRLYGTVLVPEQVIAELDDIGTPAHVKKWLLRLPEWLVIATAPDYGDASLNQLDSGERAAILLAQQQSPAVLLLMDDASGRAEADRRGIPTVGTLGVLRAAASENLLDLPSTLQRLLDTNFRISKSLAEAILAEDHEKN